MTLKKTNKKRTSGMAKPVSINNDFIDKNEIVGSVEYHKKFPSSLLEKKRDIIVWLPDGYFKKIRQKYAVLYMHDGQNILDPATAFAGNDWRIDEWVQKLAKGKKIKEMIIVGIFNTSDRIEEYSDSRKGELYRKFICQELKPFIDKRYRTLSGRKNTAVMGSSMGGLCSMLLVWKHPETFSKAACLSSSFYHNNRKIFNLVKETKYKPDIKIYFDSGEDGRWDAQNMYVLLTEKGFIIGEDMDYFFDRGAGHTEKAWANRLERPLRFLFDRKK